MRASLKWPLLIAGALTLHAAVMVGFAVIAASDSSYAVEKDYYQKAVHWDETMAQEAANAALGWQAEAQVQPAPGKTTLRISLKGPDHQPIVGAAAHVEVFHMADSSHPLQADLQEESPGIYAAFLPMRRDGKWEIRLNAKRGKQLYTATLKEYFVISP